ncbi:PC-esterase domain-containing 1A-like [Brachionus plicatilis]|uniref:PC-esterase domain-containing 1A-like n=1 Tax=Brachionus plicatilis TaxID=10195 RepID=A0A3M7PML7_BRAPC|nr:PC-esterase domain-containing 1A-like [Brachionus plicatilis]
MTSILADIFTSKEAREILRNKFVLIIGDSVVRSCYKDLIKVLQTDAHLQDQQLKAKGEITFENDTLLEGGSYGVMSNDVTYTEVREFKTNIHLVRFYFITRCYSDYLVSICEDIKDEPEKPDVVIMNSGCWDITRYGPSSINEYKKNLPMGIFSLIKVLPSSTVFIWNTTLPLSKEVRGGFMIPEIFDRQSKLREDVLEANHYAIKVMQEYKLDVLDLHYYFLNHIQRRAKDGIHWDATAHRRITNLILNHLCDVWDIKTPGRIIFTSSPKMMDLPENYEFYEEQENKCSNSNGLPNDLANKIDRVVNSIENEGSGEMFVSRNTKRFKSNHNFGHGATNFVNFNQMAPTCAQLPPANVYNQLNVQTINQIAKIQLQNQLTQMFTPIFQEKLMQSNLFQHTTNQNLNLNPKQNGKRKYSFED